MKVGPTSSSTRKVVAGQVLTCLVQAFNNEKYEVAQYDSTLKTYEKASVKIATSLAALNSGQNFIFSSALTMMMLLAAQGVVKGESRLRVI